MNHASDTTLIEEYLRGKEIALRMLYERHLPATFRFVSRLAPKGIDAEDVVQETFIKAWRHLKRFDKTKSFKTWLFVIAKNTLFDHIKKKQPALFSSLDVMEDDESKFFDVEDTRPLPDEIFAQKEARAILEIALQELGTQSRAVVVLHVMEELTFQEIAEVLGEPMNTVKTRYRRAVGMLIKKMTEKSKK
jgi:RNA polymerase sigma-70 factor (ECF subfamily)